MTTLLFVHGTGVRQDAHAEALRTIQEKVDGLGHGWVVQGCYWGTKYGASCDGRSVPTYVQTGGEGPPSPEEETIALWSILYTDPYYELRLLRLQPKSSSAPAPVPGLQPSQRLLQRVTEYEPSNETEEFFKAFHLDEHLEGAISEMRRSDALAAAAATAAPDLTVHLYAVSRALVAATLVRATSAGAFSQVSDWMRERLVESVAKDLAPVGTLAPSDWLTGIGTYIGTRLGTQWFLPRRGDVTDFAAPLAGDILRFLARPLDVENFLAARIEEIRDDVYLIGHSLGGIICVDLLSRHVPSNVKGLITVGSQAPFFHEIGALPSLQPDEPLPANMPPWLNVFDRRDMLAYIGEGVFNTDPQDDHTQGQKKRVSDVEVTSGQPFPQAHGAYWHSKKLWDEIAAFIE